MKTFFATMAMLFYLLTLPLSGAAKVYLDIDAPTIQKFPIAIADFNNLAKTEDREKLSQWFSNQLAQMLSLTNYFTIIGKAAYLEPPGQGGLSSSTIRFSDWSSIGAELLVKGAFQYDGKQLTGEFMLFDVAQGKLIVGKKYIGQLQDRKAMTVRFCNEVILALTGSSGVFDTKIAFAGKKNTAWDIYTIDFTGSVVSKLTDLRALTILPQWSPDGRQIAFTSYYTGNPDLYLIYAEGGREKKLTAFRGLTLAGPWFSDGKSMLLTSSKNGKEEIYSFNVKDGKMKQLTSDPAISVSPSLSPNGQRIAFTSDRSGSPQIYVMDADGSNVKRLTFEGNYNTSPRWSPNGDRIAFEGSRNGSFQIITIDVNGNNAMQLTTDGRNESPAWSPDGRYLAFVSTQKGKRKLCIMNSNGTNIRVLHEGMEQYLNPSWSPHLIFFN